MSHKELETKFWIKILCWKLCEWGNKGLHMFYRSESDNNIFNLEGTKVVV